MPENVYLDFVDYKNYIVKIERKHVYCQILVLLVDQEHTSYSLMFGW